MPRRSIPIASPPRLPRARREKKRRRKAKNKAKGGSARAEGGSSRAEGGSSRAKGGASRAEGSSGVSAANSTGSRANGPSGRSGAADGRVADGGASKPSRRKRGGKTRVRAEEGGEVELLSAREAKRMEANPEPKGAKRLAVRPAGKAGLANGRRRDEGSDGSRRSDRSGRAEGSRPAARALPALVAPAAPVVTVALVLQSAAAVTTTFAEARRAAGAMRGAITTSPPIAVRVEGAPVAAVPVLARAGTIVRPRAAATPPVPRAVPATVVGAGSRLRP